MTINFSIDDTILIFDDLNKNKNKYDSIFENDTLRYLKELNDKYNCKFSLFCFYEFDGISIKNCTSKFKNEFEENSSWLKFGYHGYSNDMNKYNLSKISVEDAKKYYIKTMDKLFEIVGKKSITTTVRLDRFLGSKENIIALKETEYPITGLLCADSINRQDYYLDSEINNKLLKKDYLYDDELNINLYNTDFRIEQREIIKSEDFSQDHLLVIFTHENKINDNYYKEKINRIVKNLNNYNVKYTFLD